MPRSNSPLLKIFPVIVNLALYKTWPILKELCPIMVCGGSTSLSIATVYGQNTFPSSGNVGIGTTAPTNRLDIRGRITIDNGGNAAIFTGVGNRELNRYLAIFNSTGVTSASGIKAGGMLVANDYTYADPGKSDLVVKGNIGVGTPKPTNKSVPKKS